MQTRPKKRKNCEDKSRLCQLPADLILHIFSFLDMKFVVQTSVLSKEFKNLWRSVPVLNFSCESFPTKGRTGLSQFGKFVNHVLAGHSSKTVKSFSFSRRGRVPFDLFHNIVIYAESHKLEHFDVDGSRFPDFLYSSKTLQTLKLRSSLESRLKEPLNFPQLTILHLENVVITQQNLFLSCPNLVKFTLTHYLLEKDLKTFRIVAPELAKLILSYKHDLWFTSQVNQVMLSSPKLHSFYYKGDCPILLAANELSHLDTVGIDVGGYDYKQTDLEKDQEKMSDLIWMLHTLGEAKTVMLSMGTIRELSKFPHMLKDKPTPFTNLESLRFRASEKNGTLVIPHPVRAFLCNGSPHTEVIWELQRCKQCGRRCKHFMHYTD